jgi:Tol biopolymer transport system component
VFGCKADFSKPGFAINLDMENIEASRSGDLAFGYGSYSITFNDDAGNPVTDKGKYVIGYMKQQDGQWKVIIDIRNSDLPALEVLAGQTTGSFPIWAKDGKYIFFKSNKSGKPEILVPPIPETKSDK